ncbi:hypothetical protein NMY22_g11504 [Coprinellus aureogranulatus]|nr:hypothetical protein NMY22_g11504 [Coprinellus aureogranulatus]
MAEKSADEKLAQTLKTLLSSSNRFKLEPPTVMASSPSLNMHINVNTMLNLVYDLITQGKLGDEKPGAPNTNSTAVHATTGVNAASKSPTSETATGDEAVSSTSYSNSSISMDVDPLPQPADSCSADTTSEPSTLPTARGALVPSSSIPNINDSTSMDIDDDPPPRPVDPSSSDRGSAPPSLFSGTGASRSESPATEVTAAPEEPIDLTMSPSRSPSIEISDEGQTHVATEPRARVVVPYLWWKDEMCDTMFKRFMTTRLLECRICEPDGYKSFQDDEEDVKEQIQVQIRTPSFIVPQSTAHQHRFTLHIWGEGGQLDAVYETARPRLAETTSSSTTDRDQLLTRSIGTGARFRFTLTSAMFNQLRLFRLKTSGEASTRRLRDTARISEHQVLKVREQVPLDRDPRAASCFLFIPLPLPLPAHPNSPVTSDFEKTVSPGIQDRAVQDSEKPHRPALHPRPTTAAAALRELRLCERVSKTPKTFHARHMWSESLAGFRYIRSLCFRAAVLALK